MKNYKDLLRTETYWITKIQNHLFNQIENYLLENKLTRTQFAKQLGVSKGYISQVLNGDFNHRLSKLVEISLAIGKAPILEFENLEEVVGKENRGFKKIKSKYVKRPVFTTICLKNNASTEQDMNQLQPKNHVSNVSEIETDSRWKQKQNLSYIYNSKVQLKKVN